MIIRLLKNVNYLRLRLVHIKRCPFLIRSMNEKPLSQIELSSNIKSNWPIYFQCLQIKTFMICVFKILVQLLKLRLKVKILAVVEPVFMHYYIHEKIRILNTDTSVLFRYFYCFNIFKLNTDTILFEVICCLEIWQMSKWIWN